MSSPNNSLSEITKIGNYAIPSFGAVITAALALGSIGTESSKGYAIICDFALYTLIASFTSYVHRLSWLRCRRVQKERGKEPSNLPISAVVLFLIIHLLLIGALSWRLWIHGVL